MDQMEFPSIAPVANKIEVPGFSITPNYINPAEERALLSYADQGPWENDWRRRIQQYGFGYAGHHGRTPTWLRDFPPWLRALAESVQRDAGFERAPDNCVINEYIPPLGIAPHIDYSTFGPTVACVSLSSDILLDLIPPDKARRLSIVVPARSLWVLTGEARSRWQHGIAARLTDVIDGTRRNRARRVSITFRTLNDNAEALPA